MLSKEQAEELIVQMSAKGVLFVDGMREKELLEIENLLGGPIPQALRLLLSLATPISIDNKSGEFPRWDMGIALTINNSQTFVDELFRADIEQSGYWHSRFGERPQKIEDAWGQAQRVLASQARLIPVFGNRYMIIGDVNSPVLSYHGPLDTIIYSESLVNYLCEEFNLKYPQQMISRGTAPIPGFWDEIIGA